MSTCGKVEKIEPNYAIWLGLGACMRVRKGVKNTNRLSIIEEDRMLTFVQFDLNVHRETFTQLNVELITWITNQLRENYNFDPIANVGQDVSEYVAAHLKDFISLKPPNGIVYLLEAEGTIIGMGAIKKLKDDTGEIKRMYIRPGYRGRGYGKQLLKKLLEKGREFGFSTFRLETSKFMKAAQHIYGSAGFEEREEYPEVETPVTLRQHQVFMEKIENQSYP
jgi:ribosomal protein S18 acetylase RimI-like enzyme